MAVADCVIGAEQELWPRLEGTYTVEEGQEIRLTVADVPISLDPVLLFPVNYPSFNTMAAVGDTIFIGRYLVRLGPRVQKWKYIWDPTCRTRV